MLPKIRLDSFLVAEGYFSSRSRCSDAIKRGSVKLDGEIITKPGFLLNTDNLGAINIEILDEAMPYVSRAALKLLYALDFFEIDVADRSCLDIGASTGGFTQVLRKRGAASVVAVDVGHGQLDKILLDDKKIYSLEGINARDLTEEDIYQFDVDDINLIVCDVSFISLKIALPRALSLVNKGAILLALIKPQFEAGKQHIGKNGLLKDAKKAEQVVADIVEWFKTMPDWQFEAVHECAIRGQKGNQEYMLYARKVR